jgi:signal transduction histidine kinase
MISHQLGTPLAVMDGFLTLIVQGFYGKTNDKMQEALEKTLSRTRNMKGLVFDLLNISRMTAGKFFLELSEVDMKKVVSEEVEELGRQAHDRNVKLNYHPPEHEVPTITLDEPKTRQAILNLINNAIYYSPNGIVDVYLDSDQNNIIFKVADTGIGVPDEEKPHLFTKFFRADNARKESPNGTGIGLYLVKRVVTDQHGKIIFTSQVGKGSVFGFTLPIKSEAPANSLPANNSIQDTKEADKPLAEASDKEKDKPNGTID